ncbi:hypothetical protein KUTeg_001577 [Tegillarca granosa]|uniref:Uncharacterized protein n=1 Tax=Tegillarca granosa TaxID=220873 RepID=A0ABQ9FUP4_TEGGR|nr:hypothetical protein KUTeg_001577 [Tegillarca granosa]
MQSFNAKQSRDWHEQASNSKTDVRSRDDDFLRYVEAESVVLKIRSNSQPTYIHVAAADKLSCCSYFLASSQVYCCNSHL